MRFLLLAFAGTVLSIMSESVTLGAATHGSLARYAVLTARTDTAPNFERVDVLLGPRARIRQSSGIWWEVAVRAKQDDTDPLFLFRALTTHSLFEETRRANRFERYLLRLPETGETLDFRDVHTGRALLPGWKGFERQFVPFPAQGSRSRVGFPETVEFLGHVLSLQSVDLAPTGAPSPSDSSRWEPWGDARVLSLDPELLVGTGRNFRDAEGHRLPQTPERRNYTYVPFTEAEYREMIDAGVNLFTVAPDQAKWVRSEPVFYLRGTGGDPPLRYPADLYRSNYLGPVMFMDEPAILMVGDPNIHNTLRHFSDAAALLVRRVRERYLRPGSYSAFELERQLVDAGVNPGDMRIEQHDYPAWETIFETAHYQLEGGLAGIVHEGRYRLEPFDAEIARWTGASRGHSPEELLRYHYAFLRGAARAFDRDWGTSIYGQADPGISPLALTLAYDMGARYLWFWTSDHDHHVPWPEQMALVRHLRRHAADHPRRSIRGRKPAVDRAIALPYGRILLLGNLWWVRALDPEGRNEESIRYRRFVRSAFEAIHHAMDAGEDFDIVIDDGRPIRGYNRVTRVPDE